MHLVLFRYRVPVIAATVALVTACSGAAQTSALIATLPFAADGGASIFLPVRLNGGPARWWALDSGASYCIVDRATARGAGLATKGGREIHGTGKGAARLDSIRSAISLAIGGRSLATCDHFGAVDLSGLATNGYRAIAGILGYDFFARYVVRIDFAAHVLQLYDPAKFTYTGNGDTLSLDFAGKQPRVAVRIRTAGRPEVIRHLIVDTGSEDAVDDSTVRRSAKAAGIRVPTTGLGSSYEAVIGTIDTVRIGRAQFTNVPGVASDVGIVGNGIWSRFTCVFDYAHHRLFLESR
jgi:hypothetical protein